MAMILSTFVSRFGELLFEFAKEEVELLFGVPGEIKKLQNKLRMISKFLADAERRSIDDGAIDDWLKQLKDFMYDADDILDLCRIEADKRSEGSSSTSSVCSSFPFLSWIRKPPVAHEIGTKIRELNLKLEEIWRWRSEFNLELMTSPDMQQVTSQISRKTSPVGEIDIVGSEIEEQTQSLVDLLIKDDTRRNILVFAIVGAGGIGKTTLAQRIYNDQRIQEAFSVKRWVCVSQEFDEINLLKDILNGDQSKKKNILDGSENDVAGDQSRSLLEPRVQSNLRGENLFLVLDDVAGDQSRSLLEPRVQSNLRGENLFLVLDDVWTPKVWNDLLRNTLNSCAAGSRVLITTRNEQIAKQMMAVNTHRVDTLSFEDSWSLFCKKVVLTGEEGEIQDLEDIGMEIVKKCDGLPLAIKAVAGVLCTKEKTRRAWKRVLESTAWSTSGLPEEVRGALYLSYEDLPSYLKQCFIYCSLFPEDSFFNVPLLTPLWIAEGFVKAEESLTMEETAEEYYEELIMRNILQRDLGSPLNCHMHDLLCYLGRHLARDESSTVRKVHEVGSSNAPMKLRRVYVTENEMTEIPDVFVKQNSLRTLIWKESCLSETQIDVVFNKLSHLRVLDLCGLGIGRLPDSLDSLVHLRYLDISCSMISMIPETIGNLKNLQSLIICDCRSLTRLPNSIVNLRNLRRLDLPWTEVIGMPAGLGGLQNLHSLRGFMLQRNRSEGWCTMEELRSLSCLTDLSIQRLECISSSSEARAAELRNKPKLSRLCLGCTRVNLQPSEEEMSRIKEVFEELHPPPSLEVLFIAGYFGREFPEWMAKTSSSTSILFPNLMCLNLQFCNYCERLQLCRLPPSLEIFSISFSATSVIDVGPEFSVGTSSRGSGSGGAGAKCAFPKLETLEFSDMPNLREWNWDKGIQAMPCLKNLYLWRCPKLVSLPEGLLLHATSLTKLKIRYADSLTAVENLLSLKELHIEYNPNLEKVSDLPALTTLEVKHCPKLQVVENLRSLKRMRLVDDGMKSLPSYLLKGVQRGTKKRKRVQIEHLEKLEIQCSTELIRNICQRAGPEWPAIQDIQQVRVYSKDGLFYNKFPFSFDTNFNDDTTSSCSEMPSNTI